MPAEVLAGAVDLLACVVVLFLRDRRGRHVAAIVRDGVDRESTPAGADLDHPVAGLQRQLAADGVELGDRGLLQRGFRRGKDSAGIGHGPI